jgi:hypothetical protein
MCLPCQQSHRQPVLRNRASPAGDAVHHGRSLVPRLYRSARMSEPYASAAAAAITAAAIAAAAGEQAS